MKTITRTQVIDYLNGLGDSVDWDNSENGHTNQDAWTLEQIRDEVLTGDSYAGTNLWQEILANFGAKDIK